jgi:hypothetical protein
MGASSGRPRRVTGDDVLGLHVRLPSYLCCVRGWSFPHPGAEQVCGRFQVHRLSHLPALKLRQGSVSEAGGFFMFLGVDTDLFAMGEDV